MIFFTINLIIYQNSSPFSSVQGKNSWWVRCFFGVAHAPTNRRDLMRVGIWSTRGTKAPRFAWGAVSARRRGRRRDRRRRRMGNVVPCVGGEFFCGGVGCKTDVGGYSRAQARVRRSRTSACQERGASVARVVMEPCGRAEQPVLSGSARVWRRDAEGSQQQQQWTECFRDVRSEARVMGRR